MAKRKSLNDVYVAVLVIIVGLVLYFASGYIIKALEKRFDEKETTQIDWRTEDSSIDAYFVTTDFVKDKLKSPGTATFPFSSDSSVQIEKVTGTQMYVVGGYVEASNSFGVSLKQWYMATVEKTSETSWVLKSFEWK